MADFINTIDALGDDVVIDSIIQKTITEFKDNVLTKVGSNAFSGCGNLKIVDMPLLSETGRYAFASTSLESVNFPELAAMTSYTFSDCRALQSVVLPKANNLYQGVFQRCNVLASVDTSKVARIIDSFTNCKALARLILRNTETVATINANNLSSTPIASGTGYIYVPRALVDGYKAATNWSVYADQFRALEDYTVDGTITGELDETKI